MRRLAMVVLLAGCGGPAAHVDFSGPWTIALAMERDGFTYACKGEMVVYEQDEKAVGTWTCATDPVWIPDASPEGGHAKNLTMGGTIGGSCADDSMSLTMRTNGLHPEGEPWSVSLSLTADGALVGEGVCGDLRLPVRAERHNS